MHARARECPSWDIRTTKLFIDGKFGSPSVPYARVPRAFVRQTIDLGGDAQKVDAAANEFSGSQTSNRLVITIGKFAVTDIFDTNKYAHDPHSDFMNWSLLDTGTP